MRAAPQPALDFETFACLLKLARAVEEIPSEAVQREESALAEAIVEHYLAHRPGPESFPALSLQVINLVAAPSVDSQKLGQLVSQDPALATSVLRVANSPLYKGISKIETVRGAIARLGLAEVARIASAASARSLFSPRLRTQFATLEPYFSALFQEAVTIALGASWLAMRKRQARADRAYLGGLLHDVGKSIALRSLAALIADGKVQLNAALLPRVLEQVHVLIGEDAHKNWSLPPFLVQVAAHHHDGQGQAEEMIDLSVVRLCSALRALRTQVKERPGAAAELVESAQLLEVDPYELRALDAELHLCSARAANLMGF